MHSAFDSAWHRIAAYDQGTETYSYPSTSNRLSSVTSTAPARTFLYDANGSVTSDARGSQVYGYAYDTAGRLLSVSLNGVVQADYKYDWRGQQAVRRFPASGQTIHSVFSHDGQRIAEYDEATGALIRAYVWLGDRPLAVIEGGQIYYVRTDHIGRPSFATTSASTVVWTASYLPFGGVHVVTGAPIDLRFPGQWFQMEAGLHQNWMRDYDPTTGRYVEADPLGLVEGASVYGYARQNPGRWTDPRGEFSTEPWVPVVENVVTTVVGSAKTGVGVIGGAAAGAIGLILTPTAVGDGTITDAQREAFDCCWPIYEKIQRLVDEFERRYRQQSQNRLDETFGHALQIIQKQIALRRAIDEAIAAGCYNINKKAYYYAWSHVPGPGYRFPPHFGQQ